METVGMYVCVSVRERERECDLEGILGKSPVGAFTNKKIQDDKMKLTPIINGQA